MSLATLIEPTRRRGRPRVADDPGQRQKHIECAGHLLSGRFTAGQLAALYNISRRTVYNWCDLALTYDDAEAEGLRRMFGRPGG